MPTLDDVSELFRDAMPVDLRSPTTWNQEKSLENGLVIFSV